MFLKVRKRNKNSIGFSIRGAFRYELQCGVVSDVKREGKIVI